MPLIELGEFKSHSGIRLPWKINCDALTDEDIGALAKIISDKVEFNDVYGIPKGGIRLEQALKPYAKNDPVYPMLIVDDVLTTGRSMEDALLNHGHGRDHTVGVVIFARGECPRWVTPIFTERWPFKIRE